MEQLLLHLWGDYILQSQWMAENKVKRWWPALVHATVYSLPFLIIGSPLAVLVIWATHLVIDRYRLARFVCWAKNFLAPPTIRPRTYAGGLKVYLVASTCAPPQGNERNIRNLPWKECSETGYRPSVPDWLAVWLMIIADNTLHLTINYFAIRFFP